MSDLTLVVITLVVLKTTFEIYVAFKFETRKSQVEVHLLTFPSPFNRVTFISSCLFAFHVQPFTLFFQL